MDIIKASSSLPTHLDGLHILTGNYPVTGQDKSLRITTPIRNATYISIYAVVTASLRISTIPKFASQYKQLGYSERVDSTTGTLYYDVKAPNGYTLYYYIVGSDSIKEVPTREVTDSAVAESIEPRNLKVLISNDGTQAVNTFLDDTGRSFTYSKLSTGIYRLEASPSLFSDTNTFGTVSIKQGATSFAGNSWTIHWYIVSSSDLRMVVYKNPNDGSSLVDVADLPTGAQILLDLQFNP